MTDKIEEVDRQDKSDDKKHIELEEKEKMLNTQNESVPQETPKPAEEEKKTKDLKEGMEVKPKKIPIGGIQMPGFFTRSKSKERCGEQSDVEGAELIEDENKEETAQMPARIKLPNPFRKSKAGNEAEEIAAEKIVEQKEKKNLLETIRLPLVSVFSRKKKDGDKNLENQTAQAGLASMETLDDKSADEKSNHELKNVALEDKTEKKEKDIEKQASEEDVPLVQKLKTYRLAIGVTLALLILIIIIIIIATKGPAYDKTPPIKDGKYIQTITSCGKVEGMLEDSSFAFRGIPYARPPINDLRFKYAQPLNDLRYCWNGTFLAHNATDFCLQILGNGTVTGSEDCLTLDIVTPYVRYDNPLPVVVLIGADSFMGGSPGKMRPSARYARSRDVVFVRPNFRLGVLGFLALDILSKDEYPHTSGNYGLSDILAALTWIQLNIEHFGGDPKSVTLFGHKTGATLVTALSTIDLREKYFTRAWAASGSALYPERDRQEAELDNRSFLDAVNCKDVKCLRELDAEKLITAVEDTWRRPAPDLPQIDEVPEKRHQWLVLDGRILREYPSKAWSRNDLGVRLVIGATAHGCSSEKLLRKHKNWTASLVRRHVNESLIGAKGLTDETLKMYNSTYGGLSAMISDVRTVCPLLKISTDMTGVPFYVVNQTRGPNDIADVDSDIDAIMGRYELESAEQRRYFSAMQQFFYHYVWQGEVDKTYLEPAANVLIVGQDILPNRTYSHCDYWIEKNIVLPYAALD